MKLVDFLDRKAKFFFILPSVLWLLVITAFPLIYSLLLSFLSTGASAWGKFVGLQNYIALFKNYRFWNSLRITIMFVASAVGIEMALGIGLALLLNTEIKARKFFRTLFMTPLFATPLALGYLGLILFSEASGPINTFLYTLGLKKILWFTNPKAALLSIVIVDVWKWSPFCFLVILAALQGVPQQIYEAAKLESTSHVAIFKYITLPLIAPALLTVFLLRTIEAFKVLDIPYALTSGGPGITTEAYSLYTYKVGLRFFNFGPASALAYFLMGIILIFCIFFFSKIRSIHEG